MLKRGGLPELARVRATAASLVIDGPLQRMLDAFVLGAGPMLEERDEDELLASLEVWRWATEAVARAGLTRELYIGPDKDEIESRLALLDVTRAVRRLAGRRLRRPRGGARETARVPAHAAAATRAF